MRTPTLISTLLLALGLALESDAGQNLIIIDDHLLKSSPWGSSTDDDDCNSLFGSSTATDGDCESALEPSGFYRRGLCYGEPHLWSFDGLHFDCQAQGDFLLLFSKCTRTVVIARFEAVPRNRDATWTTGIMVLEDSSSLIELAVVNGDIHLLVDGAPGNSSAPLVGVSLTNKEPYFEIELSSGIAVSAQVLDSMYMNIEVTVPVGMETAGLLGNNNGDMSDDWMTPAGNFIMLPSLYPNVTQGTTYSVANWAISNGVECLERFARLDLFESTSPELVPAPFEPYTAPVIPEDLALDQEITDLCGDNNACIFDAAVVGIEVAAATLEAFEKPEQDVTQEYHALAKIPRQASAIPTHLARTVSFPVSQPCPEGWISGSGAMACVDHPTVD